MGGYTQLLDRVVNLLPCPGGAKKWVPWLVELIFYGIKSGKTTHQAPLPGKATSSVLQMTRNTVPLLGHCYKQEYNLLRFNCWFPFLHLSLMSVVKPTDAPSDSPEVRPKWASWEAANNTVGAGYPP